VLGQLQAVAAECPVHIERVEIEHAG
jgi:hypothetical protein